MLSEEKQRQNFDNGGNSPEAWILTAQQLMASARILREQTGRFDPTRGVTGTPVPNVVLVLPTVCLLRGFGIECLLKALFLKKNLGILAKDGKYVEIPNAGAHDLVQIADAVLVKFSEKQRDVLKRLSIYMKSLGRYPIPKNWDIIKIQKLHSGGRGAPTYWTSPTDDVIVDDIEELVNKELDILMSG